VVCILQSVLQPSAQVNQHPHPDIPTSLMFSARQALRNEHFDPRRHHTFTHATDAAGSLRAERLFILRLHPLMTWVAHHGHSFNTEAILRSPARFYNLSSRWG
jgi:hypothetical protein